MSQSDDRTALVTGASSGIGYELAKQFASDGWDVVLVARSRNDLSTVATELDTEYGVTGHVVPMDLATPDGAQRLVDQVRADGHEVGALVNNAGFGVHGRFIDGDLATDHQLIALHASTVTTLTKRFGRAMVERGGGYVLNVASLAGLVPVPTSAVYSGAKHYERALSEALADEFADAGVTVTALCPGPTDTGFFDRGGFEESGFTDDEKASAAAVARAGYEGVLDGDRLVIPGVRNRLVYHLGKVLPRRWIVAAAKRAQID